MELPFEKLPDALHITLKVPVEGPTTIPHGEQQNHIPLYSHRLLPFLIPQHGGRMSWDMTCEHIF